MYVDVRGRVNNIDLKPSEGLLPVFEAVINSIHAIEDSSISNGTITIKIKRDNNPSLYDEKSTRELKPIVGFEIIDNGTGFNDGNFRSFNTSDSRFKASKGGKGVGRFLWLIAFGSAEVDSIYLRDGVKRRRLFTFSLEHDDPVTEHNDEEASDAEQRTIVRLSNFKERFQARTPHGPKPIAQRIIEHCLRYFALGNAPSILVQDEVTGSTLNLNDTYRSWVKKSETSNFVVNEQSFALTHYLLEAHAGMNHRVSYCANHRVVMEDTINLEC